MINPASSGKTHVLLVGFQDQDNLGLRYLMSSLHQAGLTSKIITYQSHPELLVAQVKHDNPEIIGFSLIFQYMTPDFANVIGILRKNQVTAHITMGGHYPSFDYEEVLQRIPELDSIVRFEGEITLVELLRKLQANEDWREIHGLAFRGPDNKVMTTPLRPPITSLDRLPPPYRDDINYGQQEMPVASILGSRGCPWKCSFCSIRPFYEAQGGQLRRLRHPDAVVDEMAQLYHQKKVSIFLFQDDDFLATGQRAREWAASIAKNLIKADLADKIAFKISCRSDEIQEDNLKQLRSCGLTHVYMGVESGDEQGLKNLNKHLKPEQHLRAGKILKSMNLSFDFGFMLLEPDSTLTSVRNNINFLETFVGDGWSVANFCRMLPYSGTPIKRKLEAENRLLGTPCQPDYHFLEPKLDIFYEWMLRTFYERNFKNTGLCRILSSLLFEAHIILPQYQKVDYNGRAYIHYLTAVCNRIAFYTLRTALDYIESTSLQSLERDRSFLQRLTHHEQKEEQKLTRELVSFHASKNYRQQKEAELVQFGLSL